MELIIHTDGGALNNPGPAAIAYSISLNNRVVIREAKNIGRATNNFAEYAALLAALKRTEQIIKNTSSSKISGAVFYSDSLLMISQLNGRFKIKNFVLRRFIAQIKEITARVGIPVVFKAIPREQNQEADSLVKKQLLAKH